MADIRCPMCGKTNSADNETCQYCQARLKPLINGPLIEPTKPPSSQPYSGEADWLSDLRSDESTEPGFEGSEPSSVPSDFGDWLSRLEEPSGAETGQPSRVPFQSEREELPDWLKNVTESPDSLPGEEKSPDWLSNIAESPASPSGEAQTPDWLQELQPQATEEAADWLQDLQPQDTEKAATEAGKLFESGKPEDWLASLGDLSTPSGGKPEAAEPAEALPDWLKPEPQPETFQQATISQESIPDWSSELDSQPEVETPPLIESTAPVEIPEQEALTPPSPEPGEMPDWFAKLGTPTEEKAPGIIPAFVMSDEELSPYVSGDEMAASDQVPGELESLPEWLSQVPAETSESAPDTLPSEEIPASEGAPQTGADLAPAELPTWLEAMRPVEAVAPSAPPPDESTSSIETMGPLAGLRGVLPVEAEIARIRKPPAYSVKLPISEAHQARVSLIEEMVATEGLPKPVVPHMAIVPQTILRLAIALFLIIAVVGALWIGGERITPLPDPKNIPQEVNNLYGQVEALSSQSPVLVAFDYEPGFSAEMEAAASQVIYHLISKRVPLVLVSTNPFGPALAERLVKNQMDLLNSQLPGGTSPYTSTQYTHLGYIPGGITGLRAFAENPAKILPRSLDQVDVWSAAPLSPSATLASFKLAMVVTDDPDTAKAWIEQAEPVLETSPLLMILSAQAAPMIRPYYDSEQVQGLVTGLAGGAAYENLFLENERVDVASKSWDAFSAALLVATILILIGSLINASLASLAQNNQKGEEHPYA